MNVYQTKKKELILIDMVINNQYYINIKAGKFLKKSIKIKTLIKFQLKFQLKFQ
jgi:hypothetical protein